MILGEFQKTKIGDFIEISTIFNKKSKKNSQKDTLNDMLSIVYMLGINSDYNYLMEYGIREKIGEVRKANDKPKPKKGSLPRKKKRKKTRKRKTLDKIRL